MKKKMTKYFRVFLLLFTFGSLIASKPCQAASADVEMKADSTEITVGDNIFVYIKINSDIDFSNFEADITYDDNVLEYAGGASVIKGGNGFLSISDMNVMDGENSRKYTLKFKASKVGICDISFSGPVKVYDYNSGYEMSVSSYDLTLNVKAAKEASSNAALKTLKISPSGLTPAFEPTVFAYQMKVDNKTEQLVITALPEDSKATVSITGDDALAEGENKVVIHVLAESGAVIEYTINVFRENAPEATITPSLVRNTLTIETIDDNQYAVYSGRYQLIEPDRSVAIPKGYQSASLIIAGVKATAFVPTDHMGSDFVLIYAINESGEAGFYQYDKTEKTLQRYVSNKAITDDNSSSDSQIQALTKEYHSNLSKAAVVIALLCGLCVLMIVLSVYFMQKHKGKKEDDLE